MIRAPEHSTHLTANLIMWLFWLICISSYVLIRTFCLSSRQLCLGPQCRFFRIHTNSPPRKIPVRLGWNTSNLCENWFSLLTFNFVHLKGSRKFRDELQYKRISRNERVFLFPVNSNLKVSESFQWFVF